MNLLQRLLNAPRADLALLVIRLFFGITLALAHGWHKVTNVGGFVGRLDEQVPLAWLLGPAVVLTEFVGGWLLAIGFLARPVACLVLVDMLVAAFHIHGADPFSDKELALAYGTIAIAILIAGPGRLSIDRRADDHVARA